MNNLLNKLLLINFWLLICVLPFGHLLRIEFVEPIALYPHDILIILFILIWSVLEWWNREKLSFTQFDLWPLLFAIVGLISWLINFPRFGTESISGLAYLGRWILLSTILIALIDSFRHKHIEFSMLKILEYFGVLVAVFGLFQYLLIPDTRFLYAFGWDDHLNRLISTLFDPGFTGLILILGLIVALTTKNISKKSIGLYLLTIALTFARSAYVTLLFIMIVWVVKTRRFITFSIMLISFVALVFLIPKSAGEGVKLMRTQSIASRQISSLNAVSVFIDNPVLGVGFNNYRLLSLNSSPLRSHSSAPDNSYLFIAATTGTVGLVVFIGGLLYFLVWSYSYDQTLFLSLLAVSIHSITNNSWFYPFVVIWIFILLAHSRSKHQEAKINLKFWRH